MTRRWLAWLLVLAAGANGQALRLDTYHVPSGQAPAAAVMVGHVPVTLVPGRRFVRSFSNAIRIGADRALTVSHALVKRGWRLTRVAVEGRTARVLHLDDSFALLEASGLAGPIARLPQDWRGSHPAEGARLSHRYVDPGSRALRERTVTWRGLEFVEGFEHGMSGSGVYDRDGVLVAVAEWTTGFAWTTLDLVAFLAASDRPRLP